MPHEVEIVEVGLDYLVWTDGGEHHYISFVDDDELPDVITREYLEMFPTVRYVHVEEVNA